MRKSYNPIHGSNLMGNRVNSNEDPRRSLISGLSSFREKRENVTTSLNHLRLQTDRVQEAVRKMQKKQEMRRSSHSYFEQVQQHRSLAQNNAINSQTAFDSTQFPFFAGREYASQRLKAQ